MGRRRAPASARYTKGDCLNALMKTCSRRVLSITTAGLLGLAAIAPAYAVAPTPWRINVGAEADGQGTQVNSFLPRAESINVGDTVKWTVKTGEIHTITFLSGLPQPALILPAPTPHFNPMAVAPAGGSSYAGTGFFNSGLMTKDQPNPTYSLTFTAAGDFPFLCLIHGNMAGTIHVANAGTAYPHTQSFYDRQASRAANHLIGATRDLRDGALDVAGEEPNQVVVGTGSLLPGIGSLAVLRMLPDSRVVKVGATVNWTNLDPETPHTITFGKDPGAVDPFGAFPPSGTDGPGHATISPAHKDVNSGFLGAALPFGAQFSVTFTQPGVYTYICSLHDNLGMMGVIHVVAGDPNDEGD
jgi:plastocyanin